MAQSPSPNARGIFGEIVALPIKDRSGALDRLCAGNPTLRARIESLLKSHDQGADLFPTDIENLSTVPPSDQVSKCPARIGHYRILGVLGEGGFGVVYEAEQTDPIKRRVALKIIKPGMDSRAILARFEAERQALAIMDHPNIAKVFDGGVTDAEHGSRPYFVMEIVKGSPITEYCDRQRLTIEQRLTLTAQVCDAIQHAHTKGIIHRDIKPSNVLVEITDSNEPSPKVIDFGVAKAMSQPLTEKTIFTEQGQMIGTPEYMSPEQAEMDAEDIDTRSDVYALGVLLYELLTGRRPFDLKQRALGEIQRIIRDEDPPRPSTKLSSLGDTATDIAEHRRTDSRSLTGRLRRELEWIPLKALRKDRAERYGSAADLATDIRRYLNGEALQAGPESSVYKARKFVRRNKGPVTAAAVVFAVLVLGVIGTSLGFARAAGLVESERLAKLEAIEKQQLADTARAEADARAEEMEQMLSFQADRLSSVDPHGMGLAIRKGLRGKLEALSDRRGLDTHESSVLLGDYDAMVAGADFTGLALKTLESEIFNPALVEIERKFGAQPIVKARLLHTISLSMKSAGILDSALEPLSEALAIRRLRLGDEHPDTLHSINNMGVLLKNLGRLSDAEAYYTEALETRRRVLGDEHPDTLDSISNMGHVLGRLGRYADAEPYHIEVLQTSRRVLGHEHPDTVEAVSSMGNSLYDLGRFIEAEVYFTEALMARRRLLGNEHPHTLDSINNMGVLLDTLGRFAEAEMYYSEALATRRRLLGDEHPRTLNSINNMGVLLKSLERYSEAESHYTEALASRRRVLGDEHQVTLDSISNMGGLLHEIGRFAEAEPYLVEALRTRRRVLGDQHPETVVSIYGMGLLCASMGRNSEAVAYYTEALRGRRLVLGDGHPDTLGLINSLANVLNYDARPRQAVLLLEADLENARRVLSESAPTSLGLYVATLGESRLALGLYPEAEACFLEAHSVFSTMQGDDAAYYTGAVCGLLVELYLTWHEQVPESGYNADAARWTARLEALQTKDSDSTNSDG